MKELTIQKGDIATNEEIFLGLDVHKDSIHVTALGADRDAEPLLRIGFQNKRCHIDALLRRFPDCEIHAVYEAGPTGYSLKRWLEEAGCHAFITPPTRMLEQKGGKQVKTDRLDSLSAAEQLRNQQLSEVHDLGDDGYCRRELTRTREQLRNHRIALSSQIKSKLLFHGVMIPEDKSTRFSEALLTWLEDGPTDDAHLNVSLASLSRTYRHLTQEMKNLKREVEALAETDDYQEDVDLLRSIPGVGILTAMIILLELGDISRFDRADEFASFLGLIPGEWSSGQTQRKRGLIRWGNKRARTALVQASWMLIGKDPRMKDIYERIKHKKNSGTAICAVARRLGLSMRAMLRDRTPYQIG